MIAIQTQYHGATNHHNARISARPLTWPTGERVPVVYVPYNHGLNTDDNHNGAARALIVKLEWFGSWASGSTKRGNVYTRVLSHMTLIVVSDK